MTHDPWFWAFVASYFFGGVMLVIWVTNGGERYTDTKRWRLVLVAAIWPLPMLTGIGQYAFDFLFD